MISTLAKSLSGSLIKGLVAVWLGDKSILDLGKDVATEAVSNKVDDFMQARKTTRMLAEIEDELLEKIGHYLEAEFRSERIGDLNLIVEDCVNFTSSDEFFDAAIDNALSEDDVFNLFREKFKDRPKQLMVNKEVYDAVSRFVVGHYIAFTAALPKFEKSTLIHLLKDTDEIIDRLVHIEMKISDFSERSTPDDDSNRREFLRSSMRSFEKISIFGVDGRNSPKKYDLSVAYINLNASNSEDDEHASTEDRISSALREDKQLTVVTGEPGSGKTTLLSWLMLQVAKRQPIGNMPNALPLLPVFVRLREYSNTDFPSGSELLNQQLGVARDNIEEVWKTDQLKRGEFFFLVDGLDELPQERRAKVSRWCQELMQTWPACKVILSSRPYASSTINELIDLFGSEKQTLAVEPMDIQQTEALIEHWYRSYSSNLLDHDDRVKAKVCSEKLKNRLTTSSNLRSITKNPLICSLICFVNFDRDGFVPDERGELYSIAIDALVERRDKERGIQQDLELSKSQKIKLLGYVSDYFWMRSSSQVPSDDVAQYLKDFLPGVGIEAERAEELVKALGQRSHILRSPTEGYLDFSHKTFMEFFLARRIVDLNLRERVTENWIEPDFREILYFVFALSTPVFLNSILVDLIKRCSSLEAKSEELRYAAIILQTATTEAAEIDPVVRSGISGLLKDVLPPNSNSEADALARTGDAIVEPLARFTAKCFQDHWTFCVRALVNSYSEDAIYALSEFAKLGDPELDRQLVAGRRLFEGDTYTHTVVRHCRTIQEFELHSHADVEILKELHSLKKLKITDFDDTWHDFEGIENLSVRELWINSVEGARDLALLGSFPNVVSLSVTDCHFLTDFSAIANLEKLQSLTIYSLELDDLGFVSTFGDLKHLDVSECTQVRDVSNLNTLTGLTEILLPYSSLYDQISLKGIMKDTSELDFDDELFEEPENSPIPPTLVEIDGQETFTDLPPDDDGEKKELRFDE